MNLKILSKILLFIMLFSGLSFQVFSTDSLTIISPNYFDEQSNIYDEIHYLQDEFLSFKFCADDEVADINFNLKCGSQNIDLGVYEYDDKCFFSNYDLSKLTCDEFDLDVNYKFDNKAKNIHRSFTKEDASLLTNHILSKDSSSLSSKDLSYYLLVLGDVKDYQSSQALDIYEELKNKRDNDEKCWPSGNCKMDDTIDILMNLKLADYSMESRMLEDGKYYLEKQIIDDAVVDEDEVETFDYEIRFEDDFNSEVDCDFKVDDEDEKTHSFDDNDDRDDLKLDGGVEDSLELDCEESIDKIFLKVFKDKTEEEEYSNDDKISFELDDSDINKYDIFTYILKIEHDFAVDEEIDCDIIIDGDEVGYKFDDDSDEDDLTFEGDFDEDIEIDCEDDLDDIYLDIYADMEDELEYTNENKIIYEISTSSDNKKYEFLYDLEYDFSGSEELECILKTDSRTSRTYNFDEDDEDDLKIEGKKAASSISLSCDKTLDKLDFKLYDIYNRAQVDEEFEDIKTHSESIPNDFSEYVCIGEGDICDYKNTLGALYVYEGDIEDSSGLEKFIDSLIVKEDEEEFVYDKDRILDTSMYLHYKDDEELVDYLKYNQNNEGSWGDNDKILNSAWAILGLDNADSDSEYIDDGKKWIYYNEPRSGWGSIEKNTIAYLAIKEKLKPYLKFTSVNSISSQQKFIITNPTIYDLKNVEVVFSDSIASFISTTEDLGELDSLDKIEFNVSVNEGLMGKKAGEIIIKGIDSKNNEVILVDMPILLQGGLPFSVKDELVKVSQGSELMKIPIQKKVDTFSVNCEYINPINQKKEKVKLTQDSEYISINNLELKEGNFTVTFTCKSNDDSFIINYPLQIEKVEKSFSSPNEVVVTSLNDFGVSIGNQLKEKQTIEISVEGAYRGVIEPAETSKILANNETREIFFQISNPEFLSALGNSSEGNIIIRGSDGYEEKIPVRVAIGENSAESSSWFWFYVIGIFVVLLIVVVVVARYRNLNNQQDSQEFHEEIHDDLMMDDLEFK